MTIRIWVGSLVCLESMRLVALFVESMGFELDAAVVVVVVVVVVAVELQTVRSKSSNRPHSNRLKANFEQMVVGEAVLVFDRTSIGWSRTPFGC